MVLLALPLLTGCGNNGTRPAVPNGSEQAGTVVLAKAEARPMERIITVTGTFSAQEKSVLSAKVSGRLQDLRVDIGSKVGQGDLLAQIEPRDYELGL